MNDPRVLLTKFVEANVPVLLWGQPGIGKTAAVNSFADDGYAVFVITGNVMSPEDVLGLPYRDGELTRFAPPNWAVEANAAEKALILMDELSTSAPSMQAAMLRVIQERYAGSLKLGDHVRFVAAANPPTLTTNGFHLSAPLANRFAHLEWSTSVEGWVRWLTGAMPGSQAAAAVAGYISARGLPALNPPVPVAASDASRAWPSPRSWAAVATLLDANSVTEHDDQMVFARALIGAAAASEFVTWLVHADLPEPATILADPSSFDWTTRADRVYAALLSMTSYVIAHPKEWVAGWNLLAHVAETTSVDIAARAATDLLESDIHDEVPFKSLKQFAPLIARVRAAV